MLETCATFWGLQLLLCVCALRVRSKLKALRKYHYTVQLLFVSVFAQMASHTCELVYLAEIGRTGKADTAWEVASWAFTGLADCVFVLGLIFVGKGWTIVRRKISVSGRIKIGVCLTVYAFTWCLCVA